MYSIGRNLRRLVKFLIERPSDAPPPTPTFDRFCIVFLVIDWIVFGSMHFAYHAETRRMLPNWVPFPDATVVGSGIVEVTIGMLLLYRRARRIDAAASLIMLILYIPAVANILQNDNALPFCSFGPMPDGSAFLPEALHTAQDGSRPLYCDPTAWPNRLWRILGVPHNVLMAICSLHLIRKPYPGPWQTVAPKRKEGRAALFNRGGAAALVAFILLLCNAAGFLALISGSRDKPTASMWMMMCLAVGALTGFLFAVPRLNTKTKNQANLLPNRNIESISDWLTKILVGLGLVNLKEIGSFLTTRSTAIAPALGTSVDFALAFIVYFVVAGFLEGYLLTRMFLQWHFVDNLQTVSSLSADDSGTLATTSVPKAGK